MSQNQRKNKRQSWNFSTLIDTGENGHKKSQFILAQAYKEGRYGLLPDRLKAEYWSKLSQSKE